MKFGFRVHCPHLQPCWHVCYIAQLCSPRVLDVRAVKAWHLTSGSYPNERGWDLTGAAVSAALPKFFRQGYGQAPVMHAPSILLTTYFHPIRGFPLLTQP